MPHDIAFPSTAALGRTRLFIALLAVVAFAVGPAARAQFSPSPNPITTSVTGARTLTGGTGTVTSTGTLTVSGSSAGVTMSGGTAGSPTTLSNGGTIQQTGTGRAVQSSGTNAVLVIQNNAGATISTANNDTVAAGTGSTTVSSVTLTNAGTIQSAAGGQAVNFNKITGGVNSIDNSGLIKATGSDAVRPGVNGTVTNSGTILSVQVSGSSSDGVDAQNNTGVVVTNNGPGLIEGGRHGVTGGPIDNTVTFTTTITNNAGGTIKGDNGSGINFDGFDAKQTATVVNHGTITGNGVTGDGDGIDIDGVVNLTNTGTIRSINAFSGVAGSPAQSEGISVGGGTIVNSGTIEGLVAAGNTNAVGRGISLLGNDITSGPLAGTREAIYGNATITNQAGGLIRGDSDSGIAVDGPASGFTVTINNNAGATIRGGGTTNAAIRTGADNDTITNGGLIDGSSSGKAIDMGAGNNTLVITGGSASVLGGIDGGSAAGNNTLTFNLGAANNAFSHSGAIANFKQVEVQSGRVTLNGNSTYTGTTKVGGGGIASSLTVNGRHDGGGVYTVMNGGSLGGTGIFALASAATKIDIQSGGELHIGGGQMTIETGSLNVDGKFTFDLNGTAAGTAGGYDQLLFSSANLGALVLGNASTLQLNLGFVPVIGQQFELINLMNSSASIAGTFAGLAEGSIFTQGGEQFQISYLGGTGNDLVVTAIPEPSTAAALLSLIVLSGALVSRAKIRKNIGRAGAL